MIESGIFSVKILRLNGITILSNNELNHPFYFGGKGLSQIMVLLVMKNSEKSILNFVDLRILGSSSSWHYNEFRHFGIYGKEIMIQKERENQMSWKFDSIPNMMRIVIRITQIN